MNLQNARLDSEPISACCEEQRVRKIGSFSLSLGVDAYEAKLVPNFVKQDVQTEFHLDRNARVLRVLHQIVDIFDRNSVNFVVHIDALHIFTVALDGVNKVLHIVVAIKFNMSIVNLVLLHDTLDHPIINLGEGA